MKFTNFLTGMAVTLTAFAGSAQTISTEYAQPGIGGKVLNEFRTNEFVDVLDLPINDMLNNAGTTVAEREKWLNDQNVGAQILKSYIADQTTFEQMKADARKSITQADLDMQMLNGLGEDAMVQNIIMRRLKNNYIFFENDIEGKVGQKHWEMYKIDLTPELYNAYINTLGTTESAPMIPMKFIKDGKYSQSSIDSEYQTAITDGDPTKGYAVFRRLTAAVPDLAIGGPVISAHPYRARMPKAAENKKLQRFYVYRTVDKNGQLQSRRIGTAYVTRLFGDTVQLYTLDGRNGSNKRGDYAVLTPGGRSAFSISGMYGLEKNGNYPRVRVDYDYLHWLSPIGVSGHVLAGVDVDFIGRSKEAFDLDNGDKFSYVNVSDGNAYAADPNPLRVGVGVGYGVAYNFMGRFSVMPYVRVNATYTTFLSMKDKNLLGTASGYEDGAYVPIVDSLGRFDLNKDNKGEFFGFRGDVGAKFSVNIVKNVSIFLGVEYNYNEGFGKKTTADDGTTAHSYFYKDLGHGKSAFNFFAGVRLVSF